VVLKSLRVVSIHNIPLYLKSCEKSVREDPRGSFVVLESLRVVSIHNVLLYLKSCEKSVREDPLWSPSHYESFAPKTSRYISKVAKKRSRGSFAVPESLRVLSTHNVMLYPKNPKKRIPEDPRGSPMAVVRLRVVSTHNVKLYPKNPQKENPRGSLRIPDGRRPITSRFGP
jgi:hypothetical protein